MSHYIEAQVSAAEALRNLKEGNQRFIEGKSIRPHQDLKRIKELLTGQKPYAVIVGCSDSRVPSEIIFDQGLGDLFIVRTAGQVSSFASWGSIEFANLVLGAKLIVVMGHTKCGAVAAACKIQMARTNSNINKSHQTCCTISETSRWGECRGKCR